MTKCVACHRSAQSGKYCLHHAQAFQSLNDHYGAWVDAYGKVSWHDFLEKLSKMKETGSWVKEVIEAEKN
jgi:hypothetical protein